MIFKPSGSEIAEFRDVREWFLTRGRTSYMRYLVSHPGESIAMASRKYTPSHAARLGRPASMLQLMPGGLLMTKNPALW